MRRVISKMRIGEGLKTLVLTASLMLTAALLVPARVYAAEEEPEFPIEEEDFFTLEADGTLTFSTRYQSALDFWRDSYKDKYGDMVTSIVMEAYTGDEYTDPIRSIGASDFKGLGNVRSVELPNGLEYIAQSAFEGCRSLAEIEIPDSVKSIGSGCFQSCTSLKRIKLSPGLTKIADYTFMYCSSLEEIEIPEDVTEIGSSAFFDCSKLKKAALPSTLTKIGTSAFENAGLKKITIPAAVTLLEDGTFQNSALEEVVMLGATPPTLTDAGRVFTDTPLLENQRPSTIRVPEGALQTYQDDKGWKRFFNELGAWEYGDVAEENKLEGIDPTADDYADATIDVRGFTKDATVYSVDVEWGAMTFRYEDSTWDATTHKMSAGDGWQVYDSVADKVVRNEAGVAVKQDAINEIKVTNHSNAEVYAALSYASGNAAYANIGGNFTKRDGDNDTKLSNGKVILGTADNSGSEDVAGTPTTGTVYFLPDGISEKNKTDGITKWSQIGTITVAIET